MPALTHTVERVPIDALRPHPRNYREHPPDQLDHIARSIELHGFYRNVVTARDHTLLAGHGVVAAARRLGITEVPVIVLDVDADDTRALQVLAGDNEMSNLAEVNDRELTELLRELATEDLDNLLSTGFDEQQLAALAMVTRPRSEMADMGAAGEWLGLPGFEPVDQVPQLNIEFASEEDRAQLLRLIEVSTIIKRMGAVWKVRWPDAPRRDIASVRFQAPA